MQNDVGHFAEPNMVEGRDGLIPTGFGQVVAPVPLQPEFSSRDETMHEDTMHISYRKLLNRCQACLHDYAAAKSEENKCSRRYLTTIAECVHSGGFDLHGLARFVGLKVSKTDEKNPYQFLMKQVDPHRDPKVVSKQSQALIYALSQCNNDPSELDEFFAKNSIKECLRMKSGTKRETKSGAFPKSNRLVLDDVTEKLEGKVTIEIEVINGKGKFIRVIEDYTTQS
jgi:hypothetical protein